jgi:hypothetical protein
MAEEMDDTVVTPPKIIAGAIYETMRNDSTTEQAMCLGRLEESNGQVIGLFRRVGLAFERYVESSDEMVPWKLVWAPDGSHNPIVEPPKKAARPNNKQK